jgi:hypothetical protein
MATTTQPTQTASFACSIEARQLADWLIKQSATADYERIITYDELGTAAGCDVVAKRNILQTARNIAQREGGAVYGTVNGIGIKLLNNSEIVGIGDHTLAHIRKTSTKTLRKLSIVRYDELTEVDKVRHNCNASFIGAMRLMTNTSSRKRLEGAVATAQAKLPVQETLRLFGAAPPNGNEG